MITPCAGAARGLREQVLLLAVQEPDLVAVGLEVEGLVGGEVFLVALVEDVSEAGGTGVERYLVDGAVRVGPRNDDEIAIETTKRRTDG